MKKVQILNPFYFETISYNTTKNSIFIFVPYFKIHIFYDGFNVYVDVIPTQLAPHLRGRNCFYHNLGFFDYIRGRLYLRNAYYGWRRDWSEELHIETNLEIVFEGVVYKIKTFYRVNFVTILMHLVNTDTIYIFQYFYSKSALTTPKRAIIYLHKHYFCTQKGQDGWHYNLKKR